MRPASISFPGLTGLRGLGALWVLTFHAQYGLDVPLAEAGYLGVDVFFILSGFVLSHAHGGMRWNWPEYRRFVRTRFARIFPMHWVALAVVVLVVLADPTIRAEMTLDFAPRDLLISTLLMQNWGFSRPITWNIPAWSLSAEWLVSLAFPAFLLAARRVRHGRAAAALCLACLLVFAAFLAVTHNPTPNVYGRAGIIRTVLEFGAGCLLYRVHAEGLGAGRLIACAAALLIGVGVLVPGLGILAVMGFPMVILLATQQGWVARMLSARPVVAFGEISYSVYLLHWILLQVSTRVAAAMGVHGLGQLAWFAGYLAVVIAISTVTYRFIEMPARRWLRGPRPLAERRVAELGQPRRA